MSLRSKIRIRLITRNANDTFDQAFWKRKVTWAWEYRKTVMGEDASCCRVLFSEADGFPGMVVDRFDDVLVAETLSVGMEQLKLVIFRCCLKCWRKTALPFAACMSATMPQRASLRASSRRRAGSQAWQVMKRPQALTRWHLARRARKLRPTATQIVENGVRYEVDFENGQKTGFFLDQKYNRRAVAKLAAGKHVLDCFTHTGSFALNAAHGGAAYVNAVDISELAVAQARKNAQLNGLEEHMDFTAVNVFDLLPQLEAARDRTYDFIVLDPPAFTKSRKTIDSAARGYKEINYRAMKLLPRGGYLATCSCSHFMDTERFKRVVSSAAHDAACSCARSRNANKRPIIPSYGASLKPTT